MGIQQEYVSVLLVSLQSEFPKKYILEILSTLFKITPSLSSENDRAGGSTCTGLVNVRDSSSVRSLDTSELLKCRDTKVINLEKLCSSDFNISRLSPG
jgi:hypothetical protein